MIIFIDESGTHKESGLSVNALVYIKSKELESIEDDIRSLLVDLKLESFHWTDHGWKVKKKFLKKIFKLNFEFKIGVFKNPIKTNEMLETIFRNLINEMAIERVWIDGRLPRWYERHLKKVLRDKDISIKKLRTVKNDSSQVGIQLADTIAGLCRYYYEHPNEVDAKKWFELLKKDKLIMEVFF